MGSEMCIRDRSEIGFATAPSESEESDNDGLPNPAQWLAMLGEEGDEDTE